MYGFTVNTLENNRLFLHYNKYVFVFINNIV